MQVLFGFTNLIIRVHLRNVKIIAEATSAPLYQARARRGVQSF
jgi:hypothetical protein